MTSDFSCEPIAALLQTGSLICIDLSTSGMGFVLSFSPFVRKPLSQGTSGC